MLLAIDIGNSDTGLGLFRGEHLIATDRFHTDRELSSRTIAEKLKKFILQNDFKSGQVDTMAVASVVPALSSIFESAAGELNIKLLYIKATMKLPLKLAYRTPETLGVDRLANAVAGYSRYEGPIMIVDYGTAIKFDVVTDDGVYLGGAIAPGPVTAGASLGEKAAQLFEIDIIRPERAIGRSSIECLQSGLFYGIVGMVDHIISAIIKEWGIHPRIIATGGLSPKFAGESRFIEMIHQNLTLEGIRLIAENRPAID
jgi:type III pantothenate kinase